MAGRPRMDPFVKSPQTDKARNLAKKVFTLQERLGISNDQMAKETGLKKATLAALKSAWLTRGVNHGFMKLSCANALVKFWNLHLTNAGKKVVKKKVKEPKPVEVHAEVPGDILDLLIRKVGLAETRKLLAAQGKTEKLETYLQNLTPEQLADLV